MGGTQDNGTLEPNGHSGVNWNRSSGATAASPASTPPTRIYRFNTFTGQANDANFRGGDASKWVVITGDIVSSPEGSYFYTPVIADPNPANAGTIYQGSNSVWRTQDWGGDQTFLEANCSGVHHAFRQRELWRLRTDRPLRRDEPHGKCRRLPGH